MVGDPVVGGQLSVTSGRRWICVILLRNRPTGMPVCRQTPGQGNRILGYFRRSKAKRWSGVITLLRLVLARLHLK